MNLDQFSSKLKVSKKIVFFTGAGISTDSGVPDFRSPGGIWTKYQPVYFDEFCSSAPARRRYWQMKKELFDLYHDVVPNEGHRFIAEFEKKETLLGVITQNIDGLHQRGGVSEGKIVELHGTDRKISCLDCGQFVETDVIFKLIEGDFKIPCCQLCGGFLKPATISFGQSMPEHAMEQARTWTLSADCFVVMGSSLQVQPAASFPAMAHHAGITLGMINRDKTPLDDLADFIYHGSIHDFLKKHEIEA